MVLAKLFLSLLAIESFKNHFIFKVLISLFGEILPMKKKLGLKLPYIRNVPNAPNINYLKISSPFATLQWKVLLHAMQQETRLHSLALY
jgi:hypothetical protein